MEITCITFHLDQGQSQPGINAKHQMYYELFTCQKSHLEAFLKPLCGCNMLLFQIVGFNGLHFQWICNESIYFFILLWFGAPAEAVF